MKHGSKNLIILFATFLLLAIILLMTSAPQQYTVEAPAPAPVVNVVPERTTLSGTYTACLPRHDNFSTEECFAGIRADDGQYYGIDFGLMSQTPPAVSPGDRITANGVLTPMEMISSDRTRYAIGVGIFSVTDGLVVEKQ